jgi:hypothetical protein
MPELHGATRLHLDAPPVYAPAEVPIVSPRELPSVMTAIFPNADKLEQLAVRLDKTQRTFDLDSLLHLQEAAEPDFVLAHSNYDCLEPSGNDFNFVFFHETPPEVFYRASVTESTGTTLA